MARSERFGAISGRRGIAAGAAAAAAFALLTTTTAGAFSGGHSGAAKPPAAKAVAVPFTQAQRATADSVNRAQLRNYLTFIASDELEGRDTPSRGLDTAAKFIAFNLARWGLTPMGDNGTFFQTIRLRRTSVDVGKSAATLNNAPLRAGADFVARSGNGVVADAPLVYVGNGYQFPAKGIDPYKGVDVKGKILIVSGDSARPFGIPAGVGFEDFRGKTDGKDYFSPQAYAQKNGALAVVTVTRASPSDALWRQVADGAERARAQTVVVGLDDEENKPGAGDSIPTIAVSPAFARTLFAGEKADGDAVLAAVETGAAPAGGAAFDLSAGKRMGVTVAEAVQNLTTQNVVAALPGGDARLKSQYIAFGAHYDHLGVASRPDADGDRIYNGADDDGSGTTALLGMAEAVGRAAQGANGAKSVRPKRSLLFVWHAGEEKGLWGSGYFTSHPTVPLKQIVTQLNIDMIGRSKTNPSDANPRNTTLSAPREIYVIGARMLSDQLGDTSDRVNNAFLKLAFNARYDDPKDPNRFYYRSDHYNYAKRGIPIIFYFDGVHEDYHRLNDEVDKIDFVKMEAVTRTVLLTGLTLADAPQPPLVNKKSDR